MCLHSIASNRLRCERLHARLPGPKSEILSAIQLVNTVRHNRQIQRRSRSHRSQAQLEEALPDAAINELNKATVSVAAKVESFNVCKDFVGITEHLPSHGESFMGCRRVVESVATKCIQL